LHVDLRALRGSISRMRFTSETFNVCDETEIVQFTPSKDTQTPILSMLVFESSNSVNGLEFWRSIKEMAILVKHTDID